MTKKEEAPGLVAGDFGSSRSAQRFFERRGGNVTHPRHHMRVGVHGLRDGGVAEAFFEHCGYRLQGQPL